MSFVPFVSDSGTAAVLWLPEEFVETAVGSEQAMPLQIVINNTAEKIERFITFSFSWIIFVFHTGDGYPPK